MASASENIINYCRSPHKNPDDADDADDADGLRMMRMMNFKNGVGRCG